MECLGLVILVWIACGVLQAIAKAEQTEQSERESGSGSVSTPKQLANASDTSPPRNWTSTGSTATVDEATPLSWSASSWQKLEAAITSLPFESSWSFHHSVRSYDQLDGDIESIWTLDLHGLNRELGHNATLLFLKDLGQSSNTRCRIISGRGNNSDGHAVLPRVVERELKRQHAQGLIAAYSDEDGYFDVRLPAKTSAIRASKSNVVRRWPCGHIRGAGESLCWDCRL
jgi:hypothetical protein